MVPSFVAMLPTIKVEALLVGFSHRYYRSTIFFLGDDDSMPIFKYSEQGMVVA